MKIDYDAPITTAEIQLLERYGWEISDDQRGARLYSEEWSSIHAAIYSTQCWIEDNREES